MKKRRRLYFILFVLASLAAATGLALYALQDNIAFFYTPSQVRKLQQESPALVAAGRHFRLGGLVKKGSLRHDAGSPVVSFTVTDEVEELRVDYAGILPDLFREGQGVVAAGSLGPQGNFAATELLAKHDEKYMPPEVARGLERAAREKKK